MVIAFPYITTLCVLPKHKKWHCCTFVQSGAAGAYTCRCNIDVRSVAVNRGSSKGSLDIRQRTSAWARDGIIGENTRFGDYDDTSSIFPLPLFRSLKIVIQVKFCSVQICGCHDDYSSSQNIISLNERSTIYTYIRIDENFETQH